MRSMRETKVANMLLFKGEFSTIFKVKDENLYFSLLWMLNEKFKNLNYKISRELSENNSKISLISFNKTKILFE